MGFSFYIKMDVCDGARGSLMYYLDTIYTVIKRTQIPLNIKLSRNKHRSTFY